MNKQRDYVKEAETELLAEVFNRTRGNPEKCREFIAALDAEKEARDLRKELQDKIFNPK